LSDFAVTVAPRSKRTSERNCIQCLIIINGALVCSFYVASGSVAKMFSEFMTALSNY
ncbi:hypothetical protein T11_4279, partial [Trichinella zimbabwensis]